MNVSDNSESIQRRMAEIRRDLNETVGEIKDQARQLRDWRYYMRQYPWAFTGTAAVVGYLMVPHRARGVHVDPKQWAELARQQVISREPQTTAGHSLVRTALSYASGLLLRSAVGYMAQKLASSTLGSRPATAEAEREAFRR